MTRLLLVALAASALATGAAAQTRPPAGCPALELSGPPVAATAAKPFHFIVVVTGGGLADQTYNWSVSSGQIESGQGRSVIEVTAPAGPVTATVEVGGYPPECATTSSVTIEVGQ
jgi:hypothetical protein